MRPAGISTRRILRFVSVRPHSRFTFINNHYTVWRTFYITFLKARCAAVRFAPLNGTYNNTCQLYPESTNTMYCFSSISMISAKFLFTPDESYRYIKYL